MSLSDYQTAAVTGASSGIGAAVAHALSRRGLKVHAIARREDRLAQQTGCVIHALDIRETPALVALLGSLKVDVLVNNAGGLDHWQTTTQSILIARWIRMSGLLSMPCGLFCLR